MIFRAIGMFEIALFFVCEWWYSTEEAFSSSSVSAATWNSKLCKANFELSSLSRIEQLLCTLLVSTLTNEYNCDSTTKLSFQREMIRCRSPFRRRFGKQVVCVGEQQEVEITRAERNVSNFGWRETSLTHPSSKLYAALTLHFLSLSNLLYWHQSKMWRLK